MRKFNQMKLTTELLSSFKSALNKLTSTKRRVYAAELCESYFSNSPRKMERALNVGRSVIELGQQERRSGIACKEQYHLRGRKKKKCLM